jgi:tryptophanyl-tRNA synthetase
MRMYTDPKRIHPTDPGTVEGNPVFTYHDAFNADRAEVAELKGRYRAGRVGDIEVKKRLAAALNAFLDPLRECRRRYGAHPDRVDEIVVEGTRRARAIADETLERAREAMKMAYYRGVRPRA